jgi:hypothetical protein
MTEKQKEAIKILNRVRNSVLRSTCGDVITEEEYFTLLEFVIGNESSIQYIPYYPRTAPLEGSPIYEQAENIFDKAVDFENQIEEANKKEEDEEEFSDDVFDILNGKVKNKNKSEDDGDMSSPLDLLAKLLAVGAASKMLRTTVDPENYKWKLFKDLEEKLGRTPTFEEFINANTNLSKEEKEKLIKEHKGSDGDSFQRMVTKVLEDLEKLNKM